MTITILGWVLFGFSAAVNIWLMWRLRLAEKALDEMALYYLFEKLED